MTTTFRVASSTEDYDVCNELLRKVGEPRILGLSFPTIMAYDAEELIGFVGTRIEKQMIIAGPLTMNSDRQRVFTAIRLAEAYESAMRNLGITRFIFCAQTGGLIDKAIKRYYPSMQPYAMRDGNAFYIWSIEDGRRRSQSTRTDSRGAPATASSGESA
jgi:hypothetical protein